FFEAKEILKRNGIVVILFDQNASEWGILETFLGRVAATTYLPDLLYKYFLCPVYMLMPQRLGVFQAKCFAEHLTLSPKQEDQSAADLGPRQNVDYAVARGMNIWLEEKLRSSEDICCDWLWVHNRWHVHRRKDHWLDLPHKRWAVDFKRLEKKIKIFIRMPNWLGDIIMALPFVKAVRQARPDTQLTLIVRQKFTQFLENLHISDCILPIGCRANGKTFYPLTYYRQLLEYRQLKPDFLIRIGNNSTTGDIETLLLNPQYCFTPYFLDKKKPYLSECIVMDRDGPKVHQTENLRYFLENMGCRGPWDLTPLESQIKPTNSIGLICGSENNPEKRWPNAHWVDLIAILLKRTDAHIVLFGTVDDHVITQKIKDQFKEESRVIDRAGQTSLVEFSNEIAHCRWVIGNDTGGVHLANFLKIPTVVLFGPSNPYKTRPIFDAPLWIIQSPDPKNFKTLTADFVAETLSHNNLLS
ncbi:MAG: hypothetical protein LBB11_02065, partial [Puniceicoccales bacterium]|nr:hypothetical protein [Puniceicoccales bacterium]